MMVSPLVVIAFAVGGACIAAAVAYSAFSTRVRKAASPVNRFSSTTAIIGGIICAVAMIGGFASQGYFS